MISSNNKTIWGFENVRAIKCMGKVIVDFKKFKQKKKLLRQYSFIWHMHHLWVYKCASQISFDYWLIWPLVYVKFLNSQFLLVIDSLGINLTITPGGPFINNVYWSTIGQFIYLGELSVLGLLIKRLPAQTSHKCYQSLPLPPVKVSLWDF